MGANSLCYKQPPGPHQVKVIIVVNIQCLSIFTVNIEQLIRSIDKFIANINDTIFVGFSNEAPEPKPSEETWLLKFML